ncbi:hypothetical protein [Streptomyces aureocirculatus]|uniref:hypothetical protein n=1 Tax=Streptomyces aureocirculatus TaxID=67275 RepID=UPI000D142188|nr:hypothetical protein [Streptomyces aureocirculatus]
MVEINGLVNRYSLLRGVQPPFEGLLLAVTAAPSAPGADHHPARQGIGVLKGKDGATTLGPWLMTPDEFDADTRVNRMRPTGQKRMGPRPGTYFRHRGARYQHSKQ